jgi:hypothetical protein
MDLLKGLKSKASIISKKEVKGNNILRWSGV